MQNGITIRRCVSAALLGLALALPTAARASEPFEGAWARTRKECGGKDDGPNSLTVVDLRVNIDGKPTPMVEQYENHCRIDSRSTAGNDTTLKVTCYEFWEHFKKKVEGRRTTIKLSLESNDTLRIDGKRYRRCPANAASGQSGKAPAPAGKKARQPAGRR